MPGSRAVPPRAWHQRSRALPALQTRYTIQPPPALSCPGSLHRQCTQGSTLSPGKAALQALPQPSVRTLAVPGQSGHKLASKPVFRAAIATRLPQT